jgi:hypothetical protein
MKDFEIGKASISPDLINPAIKALNSEVEKARMARTVPPIKKPLDQQILWRLRNRNRPGPLI